MWVVSSLLSLSSSFPTESFFWSSSNLRFKYFLFSICLISETDETEKKNQKERERRRRGERERRKENISKCVSLRTHLNQLIKPVHFLSMCFFFLTSSSNFHPSLSLPSPDTQFDSYYFFPFFFSFHKFTHPPLWMKRREKRVSEEKESGKGIA